jgi:prephenate dehydrogenase
MTWSKDTKILIVGLGLIGGSYAQALSHQGYEVGAINRSPSAIDYALERGWIKHGHTTPDPDYVGQFDLIVFGLYPTAMVEWIKEYQSMFRADALITDVTGVKKTVVYPVQEILRPDVEYIGAHPMAGREVSGVQNADMAIFKGANYIVTPTDRNTPQAIEACMELGRILGFKTVTTLSPEKHDEMIGFLSQLTHCIAVSLMVCKDARDLSDYTGDSFRDLTRIAKINDVMWSELFLLNKEELLNQMALFEEKFTKLRHCIETDDVDAMRDMMKLSTQWRTHFDKKE